MDYRSQSVEGFAASQDVYYPTTRSFYLVVYVLSYTFAYVYVNRVSQSSIIHQNQFWQVDRRTSGRRLRQK